MERPRPLNCCYAIIISQVSPRTSRSMSLRATYVPAASLRATSSTASLHRSQFPLVHGKAYPATLSPTYPSLRDTTLLFVVIDRLTKMCHLAPCNKTTSAPEFAKMFLHHVIRLHGIPDSIVSDRGSIFTSQFWNALTKSLDLKKRLSTAFHPQTDGQTEKMNQ